MCIFRKKSKTKHNIGYDNILGRYYTLLDLQPVFCGNSGITLSPLGDAQIMDTLYPTFISELWTASTQIQHYLPTLDFSSPDKVLKYMISISKATVLGLKFAYIITVNHIPAGMFIITTPYLNSQIQQYDHWTMDFFLFNLFEGKGVMSVALPRLLLFLQTIGIEDIHFIVDESNQRCLNLLLRNIPVDELDNSHWHSFIGGLRPKIFSCPLSEISFQKG